MKSYNTRAEANAANAQHSTGPKTEEGKRIASHNALKTGLTGRTVLLPTDDVAAFEAHMARLAKRYSPVGEEEEQLVENLGHIEWRLARIPTLETGILAVGREEFADLYTDKPLDVRRTMIEAKVHLTYAKPLANLALQENRLQRQHEKQRTNFQSTSCASACSTAKPNATAPSTPTSPPSNSPKPAPSTSSKNSFTVEQPCEP
jgi:hypothetical protein